MTPIEYMRRSVAKFEQTGQIVELAHAHAWATIAIAEHLEGACHAQETPAAAATADTTKPSAKRGRRTSRSDKSPALVAENSSQEATPQIGDGPSPGNSTTTTTGSDTADPPTSAVTRSPARTKRTPAVR